MSANSNLMRVEPVHASVGKFFEHDPMYRIPKYQRAYAWDITEIEDFLQDFEHCFNKRKEQSPVNHFFGGIVSVIHNVSGVVNQNEYELVDGQQRMATFVLLVSAIIGVYKELLAEAIQNGDSTNQKIIEKRVNTLSLRFIEFEQEVNRTTHSVEVLILSKADHHFFKELVRQASPTPGRDSHYKLQSAYKKIFEKIKQLTGTANLNEKLDNLEIFVQLIDGDLSLIHIKTFNKREAYTLFRVLNDRGKSLTEGDLLRARVLELLEGYQSQQQSAELIWDEILSDQSGITEEYLRWIYISNAGARPGTNTLYDDFLDKFYPQHAFSSISSSVATDILNTTKVLLVEVERCRKIQVGEWPFSGQNRISQWDVSRLSLLVKELRITITIPLLLAACNLDPQKFSSIVQIMERFMFRFKVIGNQHVTPVNQIIQRQCLNIRSNAVSYNPSALQAELHTLQMSRMPDAQFGSLLSGLMYKDGGGNQPVKYLLMTLEYYFGWYSAGASGQPVCQDKTRTYDFSGTTIEHIYPQNASPADIQVNIEPYKNSLGNLTFMGPGDNLLGANSNFVTKKPIFLNSSVNLNRRIGQKAQWTLTEVNGWVEELKNMAYKVFNI